MIRSLTPQEAHELIAAQELDVVDVRDRRDWSGGHVARARPVPLNEIEADPRGALPRDGIVFVCARGKRSLKAAELAQAAGHRDLYSIDGGTNGWASAGLPLERE